MLTNSLMNWSGAAKIDGANSFRIIRLIHLPLMMPALMAIGAYALLLSADREITPAAALRLFLTTDDTPFNVLMATGAIYALPPAAVYYIFKRCMVRAHGGAVRS
jgi:multiple sugar transport system permease protein